MFPPLFSQQQKTDFLGIFEQHSMQE